jgi:hypothetical protein
MVIAICTMNAVTNGKELGLNSEVFRPGIITYYMAVRTADQGGGTSLKGSRPAREVRFSVKKDLPTRKHICLAVLFFHKHPLAAIQ